ncbi:hypothetical protein Q5752_004064 [Cryptotrichosporon argae]
MPSLLARSNCAYHNGDDSGKTYDTNGQVCASMTHQEKIYLAVGLSFCAVVLLACGAVWLARYLRGRRAAAASDAIGTPLMGYRDAYSPVLPSAPQHTAYPGPHPPLSPSSSSHSHGNPYSPDPETFHFPVLSADGHLLPPVPASSRPVSPTARPLPSPPQIYEQAQPRLVHAPTPHNPAARWSYRADDELSSGHSEYVPVVGLYPTHSASPSIEHVDEAPEPQSAVFHRSFSDEGQDLGRYVRSFDDDHCRF